MAPTVMGPPGYASPNPDTAKGKLVSLDAHPRLGDISDDYGRDVLPHVDVEDVKPTKKSTKKKGSE